MAGQHGVDGSSLDGQRLVGGVQPLDDLVVVHATVGEHGEGAAQLGPRTGLVEELRRDRDDAPLTDAGREDLTVGDQLAHLRQLQTEPLGSVGNGQPLPDERLEVTGGGHVGLRFRGLAHRTRVCHRPDPAAHTRRPDGLEQIGTNYTSVFIL